MVKVGVFTDQLQNNTLPRATEIRIKKLIGNARTVTKQQAKILQDIIDEALKEISRIQPPLKPGVSIKNISLDYGSQAVQTKLAQLNIQSSINITTTPISNQKLLKYQDNINKMFNFGIQYSNKTPSATVKQLQETVKQSSMEYITKLGEDYKKRAGKIVADGLRNKTMPSEISKQLSNELNITRARADTIARTETMRAANLGSYSQAKRDGMTHYIIDNRAEACKYCQRSVAGRVFSIEDTSFIPPLHPNCACIPVYFRDKLEAQGWADRLSGEKQVIRDRIEKGGTKIKPDGTSSHSNDNLTNADRKRISQLKRDNKWPPTTKDPQTYNPTKKQVNTLSSYKTEGYSPVNHYLRKGEVSKSSIVSKTEIKKDVSNLDTLIKNSKTNKDMVLYRGCGNSLNNAPKGSIVKDKAFMSTSKSFEVAEGFSKNNTIMEIHYPKGSNGVDVSKTLSKNKGSNEWASEKEMLLPRNKEYEVFGKYTKKGDWDDYMYSSDDDLIILPPPKKDGTSQNTNN